jgi:[protein-PII] uridylyltransferase
VARALPIDEPFRAIPVNRALFLRILQAPVGITHALRRMNDTNILGRYLPASADRRPDAARPVPRVHGGPAHPDGGAQRAPLHDDRTRARIPVLQPADRQLPRPWLLYVARCSTTSPRAAAATTPKLGTARRAPVLRGPRPVEDTELVVFLVEQHLTMSQVAQKQDLSDPDVIARLRRWSATSAT